MKIIEIIPLENGGHRNQTVSGTVIVPDGWAVIPDDMAVPSTFPFVHLTVDNQVVVAMAEGTIPAEPEQTAAEKREAAYNTETIVLWDGDMLTVTQAAQLWQYYAAEGNSKADELTALIAEAKKKIREMYPDEIQ